MWTEESPPLTIPPYLLPIWEAAEKPIKDQGGVFTKVSVGENCWLGNGALVMANIGRGSVVAAGSVVIDDVPAGVIVGGNPAKVLRALRE